MFDVETYEHEGIPVRIVYDEMPGNPYVEWSQASEILYSGDYDFGCNPIPELGSWYRDDPSSAVMCRWLTLFGGYVLAIPFHLADYGSNGIRVRLHEPDDDPASGYLVLSRESFEHEGWADLETAEKTCRAEFGEFRAYCEGEVYGFIVAEGTEDEESCFGFYGDIKYVREEAEMTAKDIAEERARLRALPWLPTFGNPVLPAA